MLAVILAFKVIVIDQFTKLAVIEYFEKIGGTLEVAPILNIVKVYNKGISFGLFHGVAYGNLVLSCLVITIVIGLWIWFLRNLIFFNILPIGLITGGAIGNLVDRIEHAGVVDFIDFHWQGLHYPAFNIADGAIVLGVIILMFSILKTDRRES
jgi:signal peptidase II